MKKTAKFFNYNNNVWERVDTTDVVTFGTSVWIGKNDNEILIIFPAGDKLQLIPGGKLLKVKHENHSKTI